MESNESATNVGAYMNGEALLLLNLYHILYRGASACLFPVWSNGVFMGLYAQNIVIL